MTLRQSNAVLKDLNQFDPISTQITSHQQKLGPEWKLTFQNERVLIFKTERWEE